MGKVTYFVGRPQGVASLFGRFVVGCGSYKRGVIGGRRMGWLGTITLVLGVGTGTPALAAGGPALPLSLEEALARAEKDSGLVRRARAERAVVTARDVGASRWLPSNPGVSFAAGRRREEAAPERREGLQYAARLEQTLEIANQRGSRRAEVVKAIEVAAWRETWARAETRARVRAVYVGAQLAAAQARSARRREELVQRLVDGVRTRVDTGAASMVDLELARLEKGRAIRDRVTAELARDQAVSNLRVLIAVDPETSLELTSALAAPTPPPPLPELLSRARESRAELRILAASQLEMDAAVVRLRREAVPNPTLFLDLQRDLPGQTYVGGGIAVGLPVSRRNQGELALARAERGRLADDENVTIREVGAEVEHAYRAAIAFGEMVAVLENEILPAAEAGVDLVDQGWRAGKFDLFRVIQASREASDARRSQLESLGALWEASIAVNRATGTP